MKNISVQIKGTAPYYFSKPTEDKTPKTKAQAIQVAKNRIYNNGNLFIPNRQIRWTMISAVEMAKMKIEKSTKRAQNLLKTHLLMISPDEIHFQPLMTLDDVEIVEEWTHLDMGKIKAVPIARIASGWSLGFQLQIGDTFESGWIKEVLENAGFLCGIGGKRPYNGTFEVIQWNEE